MGVHYSFNFLLIYFINLSKYKDRTVVNASGRSILQSAFLKDLAKINLGTYLS